MTECVDEREESSQVERLVLEVKCAEKAEGAC